MPQFIQNITLPMVPVGVQWCVLVFQNEVSLKVSLVNPNQIHKDTHITITSTREGNLKPQTMQVLEDCLYLENIQEYVHDEDKIVSYSVVLFT